MIAVLRPSHSRRIRASPDRHDPPRLQEAGHLRARGARVVGDLEGPHAGIVLHERRLQREARAVYAELGKAWKPDASMARITSWQSGCGMLRVACLGVPWSGMAGAVPIVDAFTRLVRAP